MLAISVLSVHSARFLFVLLFYTIARVFQLYLVSDVTYEMRRKFEPTLLPTQGIINLPNHISMVCEELAFDDGTVGKWISAQLKHSDKIRTPVTRITNPVPQPTELSPHPGAK